MPRERLRKALSAPIDGLFCLPGPELTEERRQLVLTHRQETQNLLENYRQTLTEYHSPFKRQNLDSVCTEVPALREARG